MRAGHSLYILRLAFYLRFRFFNLLNTHAIYPTSSTHIALSPTPFAPLRITKRPRTPARDDGGGVRGTFSEKSRGGIAHAETRTGRIAR